MLLGRERCFSAQDPVPVDEASVCADAGLMSITANRGP